MSLIEIGKIVNVRGIKGELKVMPYVDDYEIFGSLREVYIGGKAYKVTAGRVFKNFGLLNLEGIDTIEKAETLRNKIIEADESVLPPLNENEYYVKDLIGLKVITDENEEIGEIKDVFKTGSNDVYTVSHKGREIYIPAIKQVVLNIDLETKTVTIHLIDGLI